MEKEEIKALIQTKAETKLTREKLNCSVEEAVMGKFDDAYYLGVEAGEVFFARQILKYLNE